MPGRRNPDKTREDLLQAAFHEIHRNGFRAADVNVMLKEAGVTKGALYHHFGSKKGLGFAVLEELVRETVLETWVRPLRESDSPIDALVSVLAKGCDDAEEHVGNGCPLNNLAQEMAPVDEEFRRRIEHIYDLWRQGLAEGLARGQTSGTVRADIDAERAAIFLVAACEGAIGLAKSFQSPAHLEASVEGICQYLESLRPENAAVASTAAASTATTGTAEATATA